MLMMEDKANLICSNPIHTVYSHKLQLNDCILLKEKYIQMFYFKLKTKLAEVNESLFNLIFRFFQTYLNQIQRLILILLKLKYDFILKQYLLHLQWNHLKLGKQINLYLKFQSFHNNLIPRDTNHFKSQCIQHDFHLLQ